MDELEIAGKVYLSSRRAAKENNYHADYIGQLIRSGKVIGTKVGRAWYVDRDSLAEYLGKELDPTAPKKITPHTPSVSVQVQKEVTREEKKLTVTAPEPVRRVGLTYVSDIPAPPQGSLGSNAFARPFHNHNTELVKEVKEIREVKELVDIREVSVSLPHRSRGRSFIMVLARVVFVLFAIAVCAGIFLASYLLSYRASLSDGIETDFGVYSGI